MARNEPQVNLRMPADLKEELEKAALENGRSLTAEIVLRLRDSIPPQGNLRQKLEAIADGTYVPTKRRLDIFDAEGFDPQELKKTIREMGAQLASLRRTVEEYTAIWKFDPNGEPDQEEAKERVRDFVRALAKSDARRDQAADATEGEKE